MIKVTVVIVDRANYGRLKPIMIELDDDPDIHLSVICCGSTVLKRFHCPMMEIQNSFNVTHAIFHEVEGSNVVSAVNSMAMLMPQLALALVENEPDFVVVIGDRFETLAVATVVSMLEICLVHIQGGEHSGNIDDSIRHAITKLAHYHLPATQKASWYITHHLNEQKSRILGVGCPVADLMDDIPVDGDLRDTILCVYHPQSLVDNGGIATILLQALQSLNHPVMMFWPNIDAGSESIDKAIRRFMDINDPSWLHMMVNVEPLRYLQILKSVKGCVGNSSSFIRDASFFGTSVVLLGDRQHGREVAENVKFVSLMQMDSLKLVMLEHFQQYFKPSHLYGSPGISREFVRRLKEVYPTPLKVDTYV